MTGADIFRGNPEELPVSDAEKQAVQSQATKEPASVGNAISDASKAETSNAKAGVNTATAGASNSKLDAPAVSVTDAGHAANVDAARLSAGKEGGVAAGAIASAGISTTQATSSTVNGSAPKAANAPAPASSTKADALAGAPPAAANAPVPASSTKAAAVSAAPASSKASNGAAPALKPETSGVPAGAIPVGSQATNGSSAAKTEKTLPTAPAQASNGSTIKNGSSTTDNIPTKAAVASPTTPKKSDTVRDKKGTFRGHFKGDSDAIGDTSTGSVEGSRRKSSFFGKIKHALSPHSSPSK